MQIGEVEVGKLSEPLTLSCRVLHCPFLENSFLMGENPRRGCHFNGDIKRWLPSLVFLYFYFFFVALQLLLMVTCGAPPLIDFFLS